MVGVDPFICVDRRVPQSRLVLLHTEDVVATVANDEPSGLSLGVHRICGDDPACEVEWLEQRGRRGPAFVLSSSTLR
jgi:hypothetical protein